MREASSLTQFNERREGTGEERGNELATEPSERIVIVIEFHQDHSSIVLTFFFRIKSS